MGGADSKSDSGFHQANQDKPYFFLASCPEDKLKEAIEIAKRYGGFHCVGESDGGAFYRQVPLTAWKVRAEAQFMTLKQLSPARRKVIGIAIAGFGPCNDERAFLCQFHKRKGHEQFELKQCGDVADMERWLWSEGYRSVLDSGAASSAAPPPGGRAGPAGPWATRVGGAAGAAPAEGATRVGTWASSMIFGSARTGPPAFDGQRERLLLDVHRVLEESGEVDSSNISALQDAKDKLSVAIQNAITAGAADEELEDANVRQKELQNLIEVAEKNNRRCSCCWLSCCCSQSQKLQTPEEDINNKDPKDSYVEESCFETETRLLEQRIKALEQEVKLQKAQLDEGKHGIVPIKGAADLQGLLRTGIGCRYNSSRWSGWMPAVVQGFNAHNGTYNLNVRQHAKLENISPDPNVSVLESWPAGTLVYYESGSGKQRVPAVIRSFKEGMNKAEGHYNLDVREGVVCDRIRPRLP